MTLDRDIIDKINDNIYEVVSTYVPMRRRGRSHTACCPFHGERTPSFYVTDKGFYKCFGCGAGGDSISFVMRHDKVTFMDAVKRCAGILGIEIPADATAIDTAREECMLENVAAQQLFLGNRSAIQFKDFVYNRGITDAAAEYFQIGICGTRSPNNSQVEISMLNRITFPLLDRYGRPIAFGGRTYSDAKPKYINSRDSPCYTKSKVLYNMYGAEPFIRESGECIVVEGYMDVIGLWQAKVYNVVATCGTSMTTEHAEILRKMGCNSITFIMDNDEAGRAATRRAMPIAIQSGILPLYVFFKGDPDEIAREIGEDIKTAIISARKDYFDGFCKKYDAASDIDKPKMIRDVRDIIVKSPIAFRVSLVRTLSDRLQLPATAFDPSMEGVEFRRTPVAGLISYTDEHKMLNLLNYYSGMQVNGISIPVLFFSECESIECYSPSFNEIKALTLGGQYEYTPAECDLNPDEAYRHLLLVHAKNLASCMKNQNRIVMANIETVDDMELAIKVETKLNEKISGIIPKGIMG
jgi:DNA primase